MADEIKTTTRTATTTETLTVEEERIVRMLKGLSEPDDAPLSFVKTADAEVNARLARMEAELLAHMHGQGPLAARKAPAPAPAGSSAKSAILSRLRALEDGDDD